MKTIKLVAVNNQGASVEFTGKSKRDAYSNFRDVYDSQGFKIGFYEYNEFLGYKKNTYR
jgi:hypothetical protein